MHHLYCRSCLSGHCNLVERARNYRLVSPLGVLVVALAFFLYKSPILRDWMRRQFKGVTERAVFGDVIEATQSSSDTGLLRQGVRELV